MVASKSTPAAEITAGPIALMDSPDPKHYSDLIKRYMSLTENDRQTLAGPLIHRSEAFATNDFGAAFDR